MKRLDIEDKGPLCSHIGGRLCFYSYFGTLRLDPWPQLRAQFDEGWDGAERFADFWFSISCLNEAEITCLKHDYDIAPLLDPLSENQYCFPFVTKELWYHTGWEYPRLRIAETRKYMGYAPSSYQRVVASYSDRKWHLFKFITQCPQALELWMSNPAILYMLSNNGVFRKKALIEPVQTAYACLKNKHDNILEWLGYPNTETAWHILTKIPPEHTSIKSLVDLRRTFKEPDAVRALSRLNRITSEVLLFITDRERWDWVSPKLLEELSQSAIMYNMYNSPYHTLKQVFELAKKPNKCLFPKPFISIKQIEEVFSDLFAAVSPCSFQSRAQTEPFPDPPFAGTADIIPITTPEQLNREGDILRKSITHKAAEVALKMEYYYRVTSPVRSVLQVKQSEGQWILGEVRKADDEPVDDKTARMLFESLMQSRSSS